MSALAGDAVLFVAIAAAAGFTEMRARTTLRAIRGDFAEIRRWMETTDARLAALDARRNGSDPHSEIAPHVIPRPRAS